MESYYIEDPREEEEGLVTYVEADRPLTRSVSSKIKSGKSSSTHQESIRLNCSSSNEKEGQNARTLGKPQDSNSKSLNPSTRGKMTSNYYGLRHPDSPPPPKGIQDEFLPSYLEVNQFRPLMGDQSNLLAPRPEELEEGGRQKNNHISACMSTVGYPVPLKNVCTLPISIHGRDRNRPIT